MLLQLAVLTYHDVIALPPLDMQLLLILFLGLLTAAVCDAAGQVSPMTAAGNHGLGSPGIHSTPASKKSAGLVPLVGDPMKLYDVRLKVGNQCFTALLDSGSSNLILPGTDCIGCGPVPTSYKPSTVLVSRQRIFISTTS